MGDIDTGNEETDDARDTADYQRIATIYEAISQYRSELRKLQTLQRQDIRYCDTPNNRKLIPTTKNIDNTGSR